MLTFEPVENYGTANPIIQMNWSGFDLPLTEEMRNLTFFNIKTFSTLTSNKQTRDKITGELATGPSVAYDPVNDFLSGLSLEDQEKIAIAFIYAHLEIQCGAPDASDIESVEDKVAHILDRLDMDIDLCGKTEQYVRNSNIPFADMSDAGTRPQDTPEMTFHEDEAILITAIAVFMKLVSPLMGAFISKYMGVIDNVYKEAHARTMLTPLHRRRYNKLLIKMHYYITKLVDGKLKVDATAMYNGQTLPRASRHAVDMAIIKRLVSVSLYKRDGNIVKYVASCGRGNTESQQKNIATHNSARLMADPQDQDRDEGNTSRMEVESGQSSKPADVPIILACASKRVWRQIAEREEMNLEDVESAQAFYRRNPIVINMLSQYLFCMFYGPELGGGSSIMHLNSVAIGELGAVLQMYFAKHGWHMLAHAVSINLSESPRVPERDDYLFSNGYTNLQEYTECRKTLPSGFGEREWNGRLKEIVQLLLQRILVYNTSPVAWDLIGQVPRNGKIFTDFMPLLTELMKFITLTYTSGAVE